MSKTGFWLIISLASLLPGLPRAHAQDAGGAQRKAAIIVENRAGNEFNDKVSVLEDLLASRVAGAGFSVLSRDVVTRALKEYPAAGQGAAPSDTPGKKLDSLLENNTTALRLAQSLGADFILCPSIATFGKEKKNFAGNGVVTENTVYTLRVSYLLAEAAEGGAIKGATVTAAKTIRQTAGLQTESSEVVNELLDDAAGQLADIIRVAGAALPKVEAAATVSFSIACTMNDIREQPITVPNVQVTPDNHVKKTGAAIEVQPLDVTVELDGLAVGSAPGAFHARPGLHKLRLSREGFSDWERTINVVDGQSLHVALQMSDAGYARWKDNLGFLQEIENNRKLTDAEVKKIEGIAKYFSESHYRVDTKDNVKIYKSLY